MAFGPGAVPFYGGAGSYVNGLPKGWSESNDVSGTFAEIFKWARVVCESTACDLPGVHIKFGSFVSNMCKAVRSGHVDPRHAEFVHNGLRWGFEVASRSASTLTGSRGTDSSRNTRARRAHSARV